MQIAPDGCTLCPRLVACRKQVVHGNGPLSAPIMFVG